jgi:WD40 repeat protein
LSHPNIVAVYEADQQGDTHYLAMEYVAGVTLQRLVEQSGPLPVAEACDFVRQTALGLQHATEQALVHRDIKPGNLMAVVPPGGPLWSRPLIKLLDMGVARLYQSGDFHDESLSTLTRDGSVIGTPDYVAPEQLEDPHKADIRADLYSLGCTFYFLLSGQVPFPGGTLIQKLDRQRWETPPSVDQLRPEVPPAVAAVVRRLMAKHPDDRYRTPAELADALDQLARTGVLPRGHQPAPLRETCCLRGDVGPVVAAAFLPDGKTLVSAAADRAVRRWDAETGEVQGRFAEAPYEIGCLAVVQGSGQVLVGQGAGVRLYDPATGRELARLTGHTDAVRSVGVGAGGRRVLTGSDDRTVRLWDLAAGREMLRLAGHRAGVTGVALSADGRLALSGGRDQTLYLWDASSGRELRQFAVPRGQVLGVAFTEDGRAALSCHFDTTVRLWDLETGRELRRFSGHKQMVARVAVVPGGRIVSAGHDRTLRVWDPESGAELLCCQGHTGAVTAVAVAADGRLLSGGADGTLRLWLLPG